MDITAQCPVCLTELAVTPHATVVASVQGVDLAVIAPTAPPPVNTAPVEGSTPPETEESGEPSEAGETEETTPPAA